MTAGRPKRHSASFRRVLVLVYGTVILFALLIYLLTKLIIEKNASSISMVKILGYKNREIVKVPLEEVAGKLKMIAPDASIVQEAKLMGICFGD